MILTGVIFLTAGCRTNLEILLRDNPFFEYHSLTLSDGTTLEFAVVMPEFYKADQPYPVCIAFPSGNQDKIMLESSLDRYWASASIKSNWIIVSPVAPGEIRFFEGSEKVIPELMDWILDEFNVEGKKFHIAGASAGGYSVFRVGVLYPERLFSILAFPGAPINGDLDLLENLRGLHIAMFVGLLDNPFLELMDQAAEKLEELQIPFLYHKLTNEGHIIHSITSEGWMSTLENFRPQEGTMSK